MAKIKHNNFLDTVDEVFTSAKKAGVLHLHAGGSSFTGRTIQIDGREHYHFGTTGYLGLEQDNRLKQAGIKAIKRYGTQFPLSKSYISHPLYASLEEKMEAIYSNPIVITKNSTLGHMAVIPCAVRDEDGIVLDHQVHWSVQNATQLLKTRGVPVEMIRHNNLNMLEDKIKDMSGKCRKIWYMADGVYSMYGDYAPVKELVQLSHKYPQLHLYFDDVHGMSWKGPKGGGYIMDVLGELPENILLFGTLSKTFGASGAVAACSDKKLHSQIKTFGGPLTFSAQLEPASVAAASASADIHLSPEIYDLQTELQSRIMYFNLLLDNAGLPLIQKNDSPVFYIGTGMPVTGYNLVRRLMSEGFYVNLGIYPAVPVKNTGIRITISRHNRAQEIKELVAAMQYHHPKALEDTDSSINRVYRAFRMPAPRTIEGPEKGDQLNIQYEKTIKALKKEEWDRFFSERGVFDYEGQLFLEKVFSGNKRPEHNWSFHYFIVRDKKNVPVLATFFSHALWKEDMLAPASISVKLEEKRKQDPYHLSSYVLSTGSLFTEGNHLFLNKSHRLKKRALDLLLKKVEFLDMELKASSLIVLRDFEENNDLNQLLHERGFVKVQMPESCVLDSLPWKSMDEFPKFLSSRSRKHLRKDVLRFEGNFKIRIISSATPMDIAQFFKLYTQVKENNPGLNTFSFPQKLFAEMSAHPAWEFIVLDLPEKRKETSGPIGVMFCYKTSGGTYVPAFVGMNYQCAREFNVYRQLLYQTIKRAHGLGCEKISFGLTAAFEKRKMGARVIPKVCYVQAKDNFSMELLGVMQNEL